MRIILNDITQNENVLYIRPETPLTFRWLNRFFEKRIERKWASIFGIPFYKNAFHHYLEKAQKLNKYDKVCFVFFRHEPWFFGKNGFLNYLRQEFPNAKLAYYLLNVNKYLCIDFTTFKPLFDLIITCDEKDAQQYALNKGYLGYSSMFFKNNNNEESDCFYIGNTKTRLDKILNVYEKLTSNGLKCLFYIVNVPKEKQKYPDAIHYNKVLNYDDVLKYVQKTKVIYELVQEGQVASTLRLCEAVVYGKKLLTNNENIVKSKYYSPHNIQIYRSAESIDVSFFTKQNGDIEYPNRKLLSPSNFLDYLEKCLW